MSAVDLGPVKRRVGDRAWRLTVAAGGLAVGAVAVAMIRGAHGLIGALAAGAVVVGGWTLAPWAVAMGRRSRGWIVFAVAVVGVVAWVARWLAGIAAASHAVGDPGPSLFGGVPVVPLLAALLAAGAGMVLIADAVRVWLGLAPHQRAPWKQMTDAPPQRATGIVWRAVASVMLVGWAAFIAIGLLAGDVTGQPLLQVIVMLLIAAAAGVVLGIPVLIGSLMRLDRDKIGSAHEHERQRFAAHLHDSVLQTLALVQRQAHDPVAVARLARRQEHALRAWMAGEAELVSDTLVAALRDAVATVEDEYEMTIEFSAIGDRTLDGACEELVAAAREALRNAARHAPGAPVYVFCQTSPDGGVELFVRDEGPGFDPGSVQPERRGIRDAIIGRMAFAGGRATVDSVPGEGTEVAMRLRGRKGGR
jgi:signal transduction histidine kinase